MAIYPGSQSVPERIVGQLSHMRLSAPTQLQDFAAHSETVNCLQLGRKSAQVLVTGGDDARVNMWAVGKPNPIISLEGHASAVECVSFDWNEEVVIAGSAGGQLKLWDLENSKVMRTLAGHRAGCLAVDFHPFGEYFASGSLDTNLKIWDIRKKNCIVTYTGHTKGIEHVRISPDGRWVVSGSQDGMVKLWDLRAGKLMSDFQHAAAITSMDFHPCYFQLATGCADRTVRVWDLENLQLLHHTPAEATGITSVRFVPDGRHLVTTCRDYLRARKLEPEHEICDTVRVDWNNFGDLAFNSGQLVACTMSSTFVGVWLVDLISGDSGRTSEGTLGEGTLAAHAHASAGVGTPTVTTAAGVLAASSHSAMPDVPADPTVVSAGLDAKAAARRARAKGTTATDLATAEQVVGQSGQEAGLQHSTVGDDSSSGNDTRWTPAERDAGPAPDAKRSGDGGGDRLDTMSGWHVGSADTLAVASADFERRWEASNTIASSPSNALDVEITPPVEDLDVLLRAGHRSVCETMSLRLSDLQKIGAMWTQGDMHGALASMEALHDDGAIADVFSVFLRSGGLGSGDAGAVAAQLLSLDDAAAMLPLAVRLANSHQEPHVMMGLEVAQLLLHAFAEVIASSRLLQLHNARDLAAAERAEKCARCCEQLFAMRDRASGLTQRGGHCAIKARLYLKAISTHFTT
eukprot:COSAG03_NODE_738_length_6028_cov_159.171698_5_plen_689_part_00